MKKVAISILAVTLCVLLIFNNVYAQEYSFRVEKETIQVYWNKDGTMSLDYIWDFSNQSGAHPIDFVDVGMPNPNFDMSTVKAEVNGKPVSVSKSDYQGNGSGFAVVMAAQTIPANSKGEVHVFVGQISSVLNNDDKDPNYASAVFAPTYFGSQYIVENTDLTVIFHLPPGIKSDEPRWHAAPAGFPAQPQTGIDKAGHITYTWQNRTANVYTKYIFGTSFPRSYIPADSIYAPSAPIAITPTSNIVGIVNNSVGIICAGMLVLLLIAVPIQNAVQDNRRRMEYIPPHILIEGHGIKRGLTAVEAAVLMETPLDKVMTMILFGLIKKNAAQVLKRAPLEIKVIDPLPDDLHPYEINFLKAFKDADADPSHFVVEYKRQDLLEDMMVELVRSVSQKMKGFSRKETIDYYKDIIEKAWQQVEEADTPEVKSQKIDENLEWTMLDQNYNHRAGRVLTGPIYVPTWWGRYDPGYHPLQTSTPSSGGLPSMPIQSSGGRMTLPGADLAASVVGGVQTFSSKVIGNIGDFTSRITDKTNPLPSKPRWDLGDQSVGSTKHADAAHFSRQSGIDDQGGYSCACACACAGCACACAGGGR